jgi:PKD repeat protein/lysophospholipase L1-like esterase
MIKPITFAAALIVALVFPAAASADGAIIDNGVVQLGVNDRGDLNVYGPPSAGGTGVVGLRLMSTNNDSTSPGCLCEGWGLADPATGVTGYADEAAGTANLNDVVFSSTSESAVSEVTLYDAGGNPSMRVKHTFQPAAATSFAFDVTLTVTNVGDVALDPVYRRAMDWDIEPTAFYEYVTINGNQSTSLIADSDNGFASPDPLQPQGAVDASGFFVDNGPDDHGAVFDFQLPHLAPGESTTLHFFYGATPSALQADAAISDLNAEVWSIAKPGTEDGLAFGEPNTFFWAFRGVGGSPATQHYVSLGDSVASGEGIGYGWNWNDSSRQWEGGDGSGTWESAGDDGSPGENCHRTPQAYGHLVAADLNARLFHFACSGWTAIDVLNGILTNERSEGGLAYAASAPQKVSLTVGADDVEFSKFVGDCYSGNPFHACDNDENQGRADSLLADEKENLQALLDYLKQASGNPPLIAVTDYYSPFGLDRSCSDYHVFRGGFFSLSGHEQSWLSANLAALNANIRKVARQFPNVVYVPLDSIMQDHEWCSSDPWVYGPSIRRKDLDSAAPFHPTPEGQDAIAERVAAALAPERSVPFGSSTLAFSDGTRLSYTDVTDPGYAAILRRHGGGVATAAAPFSARGASTTAALPVASMLEADPQAPAPSSFVPHEVFQVASSAATDSPIELWIPEEHPGLVLYEEVGDSWQPVEEQENTGAYLIARLTKLGEFILGEPAPTVSAEAEATPQETQAPALIQFSASGSEVEEGSLVEYRWDFGDGQTGEGIAPSHLYELSGQYLVKVTVVSDAGAEATAEVEVQVDEVPPQVQLELPAFGEVGTPVELHAKVSSSGQIVGDLWQFGDGFEADGSASTTHSFSEAGTYQVTYTAVDADGTPAAATVPIQIFLPGEAPKEEEQSGGSDVGRGGSPSATSPRSAGPGPNAISPPDAAAPPPQVKVRCKKAQVRRHGKCVKKKRKRRRHGSKGTGVHHR